jgi:hypothetical protein
LVWGAVMVARGSWVIIHVGCHDMVVVGGVVGLLLWCDVASSLSRSAVVVGGGRTMVEGGRGCWWWW